MGRRRAGQPIGFTTGHVKVLALSDAEVIDLSSALGMPVDAELRLQLNWIIASILTSAQTSQLLPTEREYAIASAKLAKKLTEVAGILAGSVGIMESHSDVLVPYSLKQVWFNLASKPGLYGGYATQEASRAVLHLAKFAIEQARQAEHRARTRKRTRDRDLLDLLASIYRQARRIGIPTSLPSHGDESRASEMPFPTFCRLVVRLTHQRSITSCDKALQQRTTRWANLPDKTFVQHLREAQIRFERETGAEGPGP